MAVMAGRRNGCCAKRAKYQKIAQRQFSGMKKALTEIFKL